MNLKTFAIETFEIAEWNVLKAIFRLKPKDFEKQITPKHNPIRWIIGHLTMHMDTIFNYLCLGKRELSQEFREYFTSGVEREEEKEFPVSYKELIDTFLEFSKTSIDYLYDLPEEKFNELPENNDNRNVETVSELIQRISLHFLGHTGQIYLIKRELGKGGFFVTGVKKKNREASRIKWLDWWNDKKGNYE
ncbi:MAG: DinB family protein [Promethearchaeota archaeon]